MKRLIVSADDFGLTEGINNGIIKSFQEGIVTSASLMPNMPGFEHAVDLAKGNPGLAIGVHLNLLRGKPLQLPDKVASLLDRGGVFYQLPEFARRLVLGKIVIGEVEKELRSQIERVVATQLKISHIDSHRHFHVYPSILKVALKLAKEYQINKIRYPRGLSNFPTNWKELLLLFLSLRASGALSKNNIKHGQRFFEFLRIESSKNPLQFFETFCRNLPEGVTELCCHPGFVTEELNGSEAIIHNRERQIEILTNPGVLKFLQKYDIKLISYEGIG